MRLEIAGEKAVQHTVREASSETDEERRAATNGVASTRPLAGDRVRDDLTYLLGTHSSGDRGLGLRDD